ncbi:TetR/AcrR family transcriptional regulator [Nocardiopsis baichengensis]|uniref:TetR/AcrR family transcriptional regulator n=1 Tax=Nocardiopsis baichengensis TaxID=280240 RepID=UPI00034CAABD|nr:TetR/AcrR family transcriptional regulator [Nocardiopsis baichengensis]
MERAEITRTVAEHIVFNVNSSPDDVAAGIGVAPSVLREHFPDDRSLRRAVCTFGISEVQQRIRAARLEEGPADAALQRLVEATWDRASLRAFMYGENQLHGDPELDTGFAAIEAATVDLFERGRQEGVFRSDVPAAWMSESFWALLAVTAWCVTDSFIEAQDGPPSIAALLLDGITARN